MFTRSHYWVIAFCIQMVSIPVSYAASDYNAKFSQLYKDGNFKEAVRYAHHLSSKNPGNMTMRYYYADCLMKIGKSEQAKREFAVITKYSDDRRLITLSKQVLNSLEKKTEAAPKDKFDEKLTNELKEQRKRYLDQAKTEKEAVMRQFDSKISNIQNSSLREAEKERRLERAYKELKDQKNSITMRYQKKADELLTRKQSLITGSRNTASSIRVVPNMSGMNVQNYENLGDDSDVEYIPEKPPLRAKAKLLKTKTTQKKQISGKKSNAHKLLPPTIVPAGTSFVFIELGYQC